MKLSLESSSRPIEPSKPETGPSGIEAKMLKIEGREIVQHAEENLGRHYDNLMTFEQLFEALDGDPLYAEMHNELLRRAYEAGTTVEDAERGLVEDEQALKELDA